MASAIPMIILAAGTLASQIQESRQDVLPGPDPDLARKKANEAQTKIQNSRETFLQRQGTLGPIQLQAPTLKI